MNTRTLGKDGPEVSEIGLGCMGMSAFYGAADEGEAQRTIHRALDLGCNFLDTSDMYGPHTNERLLGRAKKLSTIGSLCTASGCLFRLSKWDICNPTLWKHLSS